MHKLFWKLRLSQAGRKKALATLVSFKISVITWSIVKNLNDHSHNSSLTLSEATLSADLNTVGIFSWSDRLNLIGEQVENITQGRKFCDPFWCYWNVLPAMTFFKKEISGTILITQNSGQQSTFRSHLASVCKRRCVCSASIPWQSWVNRCVLGDVYFNVVDNFNPILQNVRFFSASQHFSVNDTVCSLIFRRDLFDPSSETGRSSSHSSYSVSAYNDTKRPTQLPCM